jgi:hypothetical protein
MIIIEIFERGCAQQYSPDQPGGPRFARDSLLEESGFELLVPLATEMLIESAKGISKQLGCWGRRHGVGTAAVLILKWDQRFESAFLQQ